MRPGKFFCHNYRKDITTAHIVHFHGVDYAITRVDTFDGFKNDFTLYAKKKS